MGRRPSADAKLMRDDIKSFFISNPNVWVTGNDLIKRCGLNINRPALTYHINKMLNNGEFPGELINGQDGLMFIPEDRADEPAIEEPADKFISPWVNQEGYSDPTAKKALDSTCRFHDGDVWEVQKHDGNTELILVLKAYETKPIVVPIFTPEEYRITEENKAYTSHISCIRYNDAYGYFFDRRCIRSKPGKYFLEQQFQLNGSEYTKIIADVSRLFYDEDVAKRIDILEKQANKYRAMINDLKFKKSELEETVKDLTSKMSALSQSSTNDLAEQLADYAAENQRLRDDISYLEAHKEAPEELILKVKIYEKILGITWED